MTYRIMQLKDKLLEDLMKEAQERGVGRLDGEKVDMVKDLAEAAYYCKVTEAMEGSSGYSTTGNPASGGGNMGYGMNRSMGHTELIDQLGKEFSAMNPEERMTMRNRVLSMLGSM